MSVREKVKEKDLVLVLELELEKKKEEGSTLVICNPNTSERQIRNIA